LPPDDVGLWGPPFKEDPVLRFVLIASTLIVCLSGSAVAQKAVSGTQSAAAKPSTVVNLNTATAAELETLPGIGARVAARIIEYRTKQGPFRKVEELMNVQGIGEKSFLKLRPQLVVTTKAETTEQR
jgi:competence protein ComEA